MIRAVENTKDKVSVLVVEDDADSYKFLEAIMKSCCEETSIHWVQDGEQAVDYLFRRGEYQDETRYPVTRTWFFWISEFPRKTGWRWRKLSRKTLV